MPRTLLLSAFVCLSLGCGAVHGEVTQPLEGAVEMSAIFAVPGSGVSCIQISVTGAKGSVVKSFDVAPGQSTVTLPLRGVPSGTTLVSGGAYPVSCGFVTSATEPTWLADAVTADVPSTGAPLALAITFRPNGKVNLGANFVSDSYTVSTIAGVAGVQATVDAVGTAARLQGPNALALIGDALWINDRNIPTVSGMIVGNTLRRMSLSTGQVETLVGSDTAVGPVDGDGLAARFIFLRSVVAYGSDLLVSDRCAIRRVSTTAPYTVTTIFGTPNAAGTSFTCAPLSGALLDIAVHGTDLYVLESSLGAIWRGSLATPAFTPTLLAGAPGVLGSSDGTLATARFQQPTGVVFPSPASDVFYVSDTSTSEDGTMVWSTIRRVSPADNTVTTVAGAPSSANTSVDGIGTGAVFNSARRLASDGQSLFTGDNTSVRRIDLTSYAVITIAGSNTQGSADGVGAAAQFYAPYGLALAPDGSIYAADQGNFTIRKLTP